MHPDHVVLLLDDSTKNNEPSFDCQICVHRNWNKLSKLQKQVLFLMIVTAFIIFYFFGILQSDYSNNILKPPGNVVKLSDDYSASENIKKKKFNDRQKEVIEAFKFAWKNYKKYAWGHDVLKPVAKSYKDDYHLGLSIVDSIDTMFLMDLKEDYNEARNWIENQLTFSHDKFVSLFEVTIRVLGGLLSIYHLTEDTMFLRKAQELGDKLSIAFNPHSNVPYSDVNFHLNISQSPFWLKFSSTAEIATIQLEFRDLSRSSHVAKYEQSVANISLHIHQLNKTDGLVPIYISPQDGNFHVSTITMGARGDSYYEYLLKQWIQTGKQIDYLRSDYIEAINGAEKHLMKRTPIQKLLFIGEILNDQKFSPKMDHLTCYLPGTLMLGVQHGLPKKHQTLAEHLMRTCYKMYEINANFLTGEIVHFRMNSSYSKDEIYVKENDNYNLLRPEFVESLYYMFYYTGNKTYQDWGYNIFNAFLKQSKVENGFLGIYNDDKSPQAIFHDEMDSYFLSETLKYFLLLFDDDRILLDLNKFVLNTEGHPLPIYTH